MVMTRAPELLARQTVVAIFLYRDTLASAGDHEDKWSVGGVQIADNEYEIIAPPNSVSVQNVSVIALTAQCMALGNTYGILVDITYQISSAAGHFDTTIPIVPFEDVIFYGNGGVQIGTAHKDIGPSPGYPDSSEFTSDTGVFHDVPVGTCSPIAFSNAGASQTISMDIGNNNYVVRSSQRIVTASSSSGHGSITNNNDINATR
jgi:hypothetical protein